MEEKFIWPESAGLWKQTSTSSKTAFLSACLLGILTHIYSFTNLLLNHDSVWRTFYDNDTLTSGRWLLKVVSDFSTRLQMPVVIAAISILMLALTAGLTVSIFNISNKLSSVLVAAFLVTFPSVACIFSYMYTADAYFICLFLNTLAVYLAKKYRWGWLPAIALCAMACGIYQAFICYAIGLFLLECILDLLTDKPISKTLRKGLKYIAVTVLSLILYYLVLMVCLKVQGKTLSSYQGINAMSLTNMEGFFSQIPLTYQRFLSYFKSLPYGTPFYQIVQILYFLLSFGALFYLVFVRRLFRKLLRLALVVLGILLIPLALNFITVLSVGANVHALMIYAFVLQYIFAIKLIELTLQSMISKGISHWRLLHLAGTILAALLLWNNFCVSNMAYLHLQICYENSFALANRIAARIEALDGYTPELPVAVVGEASRALYGGTVDGFSQIDSLTGTGDTLLYSPEAHRRTRYFIEDYIGLHMPAPSQEQKDLLNASDVIKALPTYPQEGSIVLYEGVVVVKLSNGPVR